MSLTDTLALYGGPIPVKFNVNGILVEETYTPLLDFLYTVHPVCPGCNGCQAARRNEIMNTGDKNAKLATKVTQWLYQKYGQKFTDEQQKELAVVCSTLGQNVKDHEVYVHTDRRVWWLRGSFADGHSCFWGGEHPYKDRINEYCRDFLSLTVMATEGGSKITPMMGTILDDLDKWRGLGRGWLVFDNDKKDTVALASVYGMNMDFWKSLVSKMFPEHQMTDDQYLEHRISWEHGIYDNGSFIFYPKDKAPVTHINPSFRLGRIEEAGSEAIDD